MMKSAGLVVLALAASLGWAGPNRAQVLKGFDEKSRVELVPGRIRVKLPASLMQKGEAAILAKNIVPGGTLLGRVGNTLWTNWQVDPSTDTAALSQTIKNQGKALWAEPAQRIKLIWTDPNDPDWGALETRADYYFAIDEETITPFERLWNLNDINAQAGWTVYPNQWYTSANKPKHPATIAVIDSGLDRSHPDFRNTGAINSDTKNGGQIDWSRSRAIFGGMVQGEVGDDNGHGTHVSGIAFAAGNNGGYNDFGVIGVGYPCQGTGYQIIGAGGGGDDTDAALAIMYAADKGADVMNMSFGTQNFGSPTLSLLMQEACTYAFQKGAVLVAAANEAADPTNLPATFPAACSGVLGVSAWVYGKSAQASYSAQGDYIDLGAPGGDLLTDGNLNLYFTYVHSTMPTYHVALNDFTGLLVPIGQDYASLIGTSFASPHVAGAAGLYMAKNGLERKGGWANVRTAQALMRGATGSGITPSNGWGNLDLEAAMNDQLAGGKTTGAIEGLVFFGTPASTASVRAKKVGSTFQRTSTTSTLGLYRIVGLQPGLYELTAQKDFSTKTKLVYVVAGADTPGVDVWIGGNPNDTTPPEIRRFELATSPTLAQVQFKHWSLDTETGIDSIKIKIGTTPGGSQTKAETEIAPDGDIATLSGLSMTSGTTYWARMTVTNGAGNSTTWDTPFRAGIARQVVSGKVTLESLATPGYGKSGVAGLRVVGQAEPLASYPVNVEPDGKFSFATNLAGSYEGTLKVSHWLRGKVGGISGGSTNMNLTLLNGDINGDNYVGTDDYLILNASFDSTWGDGSYVAMADLNEDDTIGTDDYLILNTRFDQNGE